MLCHESGLHEFDPGRDVKGFAFGDELAPGIVAQEMGAICPDDSALQIRVGAGALALADGVVDWGGGNVGFVPDRFMDDPPKVKDGIRASVRRLAELDFESVLFAHGDPIVGEGRAALHSFLEQ